MRVMQSRPARNYDDCGAPLRRFLEGCGSYMFVGMLRLQAKHTIVSRALNKQLKVLFSASGQPKGRERRRSASNSRKPHQEHLLRITVTAHEWLTAPLSQGVRAALVPMPARTGGFACLMHHAENARS